MLPVSRYLSWSKEVFVAVLVPSELRFRVVIFDSEYVFRECGLVAKLRNVDGAELLRAGMIDFRSRRLTVAVTTTGRLQTMRDMQS